MRHCENCALSAGMAKKWLKSIDAMCSAH